MQKGDDSTWVLTPGRGVEGKVPEDAGLGTIAVATELHQIPVKFAATPVVPPIVQASTYKFDSMEEYWEIIKHGGHYYSRLGNPSTEAVEATITELEGGYGTVVFGSGMAAISNTLLYLLKPGDNVLCCVPCYGGTHKFLKEVLTKYGVDITWVTDGEGSGVEKFRKAVKPNTKLMYGESPCNPKNTLLDLEAFGSLGQELGITTMVDATFASPYLIQPIKCGVDIVMHSCTKFMGGHADLLAGCVTTRTRDLWVGVKDFQTILGGCLSPTDATLLHRGIRTLHVRMEAHSQNALQVAQFLEEHPKVERVFYPGLPSHPNHELARRTLRAFGGMVSFDLKGGTPDCVKLMESVKLIQFAVSLGGTMSLMEHPATMTHPPWIVSAEERKAAGITDGLIRFSVGLEDAKDIISDLRQALDQVPDGDTPTQKRED